MDSEVNKKYVSNINLKNAFEVSQTCGTTIKYYRRKKVWHLCQKLLTTADTWRRAF